MGIIQSFHIGKKGEDKLVELLEKAGLFCERAIGKQELWDIRADLGLQSIFLEVKFDKMSDATGNLALEFHNPKSNKKSGIHATLSDFWVFCFGNPIEVWFTEVDVLKKYVEENKPFKVIDVGGDDNASLLLYKKNILLNDIFYRIDNIEAEELESVIKLYIQERNKNYINNVVKGEIEGQNV